MPPTPTLESKSLPVACFAPPLTDDLLAAYEQVANGLPDARGDVRDAMRECLAAVRLWWELSESKGSPKDQSVELLHRGKDTLVKVVSLTPDLVQKLWDAVPWGYELKSMQKLFDRAFHGIDEETGKPVHAPWLADAAARDAAYHLLWHARELCLDREPLTRDRLPE